jgi:hypothetical protein
VHAFVAESSYDLVLHLVTTAHGAEGIYEQEFTNNPTRTEVCAAATVTLGPRCLPVPHPSR